MNLSQMDHVRAAIAQAKHEGLTLDDLERCAENAASCEGFCDAVNLFAHMMEQKKS